MNAFMKAMFIIGVILALVGSFLPWRRQGDFISIWSYGIQVYPFLIDNGGFLVVILTLLVTAIVLRSPNIGEKQLVWSILISLTLVIDSIFHIYKLIISRANAGGVIGSPVIQIGLVMVFIGSILLLLSTSVKYLKPLL